MKRPRARRGEATEWVRNAIAYKGKRCLIWPFARAGGNDGETYGYFSAAKEYLHRYICRAVHGRPLQNQNEAEHLCGNGLCGTPAHLQWSTHTENIQRKKEHGTHPEGVKNPAARLTEKDVKEIRASKKSPEHLAAIYGVCVRQIRNVIGRVHWRHV